MKVLWINAIDNFSEVETRYPNVGIAYLISSLIGQFGNIFDLPPRRRISRLKRRVDCRAFQREGSH